MQTLLHHAPQQWCPPQHCRNQRYAQAESCDPPIDKLTDSFRAVWATLVTNTNYLPGLFTLEYSLRKVGSKYALVVLYTDSFPAEGHAAVNARGLPKQRVPHLLPTLPKEYTNDPRFHDTWTKLTAFSLVEYERVVLLDSDMLVMQNMDELMDMELDAPELEGSGSRVFAASHACVCNPLKKPHYPKNWYDLSVSRGSSDWLRPRLTETCTGSRPTARLHHSMPLPTRPRQTEHHRTVDLDSATRASSSSIRRKESMIGSLTSSTPPQR